MLKSNSSHLSTQWCSLENGEVGPLDNELSQFLGSLQNPNVPIGIDLSQIRFIEPASMIVLLAIYSDRKRNNWLTTIKFPKDLAVRRIMGRWKFLDALKVVGHLSVPAVSVDDTSRSSRRDSLEDRLKQAYFPIKIICGANGEDKPNNQHVDEELERTNGTLLMSWLQHHLTSPRGIDRNEWRNFVRDVFPSRIVFEAMMNAVRHPEATKIVTTSHIQWNPEKPKEGHFTCIWWDDGKGIIETLSEVIKGGGSVVSEAPSLPEKRCAIELKNIQRHRQRYQTFTTNYIPTSNSTDAEILFSSICSRITRDPAGIGHRTILSDEIPEDSPLRQPGMGLYILVDCAVNIFHGSVAFRTGNLFMNVKRSNKNTADYSVSISSRSPTFKFPGNMLIVRLPIQEKPPR